MSLSFRSYVYDYCIRQEEEEIDMTPVEYWNNKLDKALCIAFHIKRIIEGADPHKMLERVEKEEKEIYEALIEAEKEDPNI